MNPGVTVAPAASICRDCAFARFLMSAVEPMAMIVPPLVYAVPGVQVIEYLCCRKP